MSFIGKKPADTIQSAQMLADGTVTTAKIQDNAVTSAKIPSAAITQAKMAAGVAGNGPAFSATAASFPVSTSAKTLAPIASEDFDTAGNFNNTGATAGGIPPYSFKPSVAGYYLISCGVQYSGTPYANYFVALLFKNGAAYRESVGSAAAPFVWTYSSHVVYLNGVSDSIQLYVNHQQGTTQAMAANMSAALIRSAT